MPVMPARAPASALHGPTHIDADLGQHPQAVLLAGWLDDPRQHESPLNRRLRGYAEGEWRQKLAAACARHAALGPTSPSGCSATDPG